MRITSLATLVTTTLLLSSCGGSSGQATPVNPTTGDNTPGGGGATPALLAVKASTSISHATQGVTGAHVSFAVSNAVAGDTFECSVQKGTGSATAVSCTPSAEGVVEVPVAATGTDVRGLYHVRIRATHASDAAVEAEQATYLHDTLNGVSHCPAAASADSIFAKALETIAKGAAFSTDSTLVSPQIHLGFSDNRTADILSLRRRFQFNADRTLLLVEREYPSTQSSNVDCSPGIAFQGLRPVKVGGNFPFFRSACDYLVVNANGEAACLGVTQGALTLVDHLSNMQKRLTKHAMHKPFNSHSTKNPSQAANDPTNFVYLPD